MQEVSDNPVISLTDLPATLEQRRLVLILGAILLVAFGAAAPFANRPLPALPAVIPSLAGMIAVNDLITSVLLFAQYSIAPSRAILVLASGYLFTAVIVIPQALTFPGAFTLTGLIGAGLQSAGHLYMFWHIGSPLAVLIYACLKDRGSDAKIGSTRSTILWTITIVVALVFGLTWYVTSGLFLLPFFVDSFNIVKVTWANAVNVGLVIFDLVVLLVLWDRRRSVLDYWLLLVVFSMITEQLLLIVLSSARFTLGFYAGRAFSLVTSIFVLVLLLQETTRLYTRLARSTIMLERSNKMLERERDNKLLNAQAVTVAIAHEIRQPLAAITANASAAERWLERTPPNHDEVRASLNRIKSQGYRASEVFDSIRTLFGKIDQARQPVDLNNIILGVLQSLQGQLKDHGVVAYQELSAQLPVIKGHGGQLREVMFNLVNNAVEAMNATTNRSRVLRVRTELNCQGKIAVSVQDSGPGIDPKQIDGVFGAFVTTKAHGTGFGLAICRMIVEQHGGQLSAYSDGKSGATFQFALPIEEVTSAPA